MFTRYVEIKDSNTIHAIAYDFEAKILRIWFSSTGSVWDYLDVYPTEFAKLASAYSPGEVFNARLRNKFDCVRVEPEEKEPASIVQRTRTLPL